jgi:hypothetical protein
VCLVGMGIDGQSRSFEVMAISRPDDLGDIANLGLTLAEAQEFLTTSDGRFRPKADFHLVRRHVDSMTGFIRIRN